MRKGKFVLAMLLAGIAAATAGCTGMGNYLNGTNWDGSPVYTMARLIITNHTDEVVREIWGRDGDDPTWRYLGGSPAIIGMPYLKKGESKTVDVVAGRNEIKLITMNNREIIRPVYVGKTGGTLQLGQPPAPEPAPAQRYAAAPAAPAPVLSASPDPEPARPARTGSNTVYGEWRTPKVENAAYLNVNWNTLSLREDGSATWRWYQDFTHSTLRNDRDSCHVETTEFRMHFSKQPDGTWDMACKAKKIHWCGGRVEQRGCFSDPIQLEVTADGLVLSNGYESMLYTR